MLNILKQKVMTKSQLMILCAIILVIVIWMPAVPIHQAWAADCYGATCHGFNPQSMGCQTGSTTGNTKSWYSGKAENRFSTTCDAEWERTTNMMFTQYAAGTIRWGTTYYYSWSVSSPDPIAPLAKVYTPMKGPQTTTKSCGYTFSEFPIAVPLPISPTYCTNPG